MFIGEILPETLDALIVSGDLVIVDFWAEWCVPCKHFALTYEQVAEKYPQVSFTKVNVEAQPALAETFEIRSVPHLMVFKYGMLIFSESGSMPASGLNELVEQALKIEQSAVK
jgi:thioredoxin 1